MKGFSFSSLAVQPPEGSAATVLLTNLLPLIPSAVPLLRALTVFTLITVGANDKRLLRDNLVNIAYILLLFFPLSLLYKLNEKPHRHSLWLRVECFVLLVLPAVLDCSCDRQRSHLLIAIKSGILN